MSVSWLSMPQKGQVSLLLLARTIEPASQMSFQAYMYFQLSWLDVALSDESISSQAGWLSAAFAASASITALFWGKLADRSGSGGKTIVLAGVFLSFISCVGTAFATSFPALLFFRILAGSAAGNVGIIRAILAETVQDERYHARIFALLPLCPTLGTIFGSTLVPLISSTGRQDLMDNSSFLERWPFAAPNLVLACAALITLYAVQTRLQDSGSRTADNTDRVPNVLEMQEEAARSQSSSLGLSTGMKLFHEESGRVAEEYRPRKSAMWKIVLQVSITIHFTAYATVTSIFLPAPLCPDNICNGQHWVAEGVGFSLDSVAAITIAISSILCAMQLGLFPSVHRSLGSSQSLMAFMPISSAAYLAFMIFLVPIDSAAVRTALVFSLLSIHNLSRAICQPAALLLINESVSAPHSRFQIHSVAHAFNAGAAAVGLSLGGYLMQFGLHTHFVGWAWIALAALTAPSILLIIQARDP
ncbi:MFS general substrate transporter [Stipitochalara longipes BDJ]|nr:MFS general substrate transporter [Stipitochalara longipes BDJ]